MGELEDRINSVLSDPEQLQQITKMAQSLMGGNSGQESSGAASAPGAELFSQLGLDSGALGRISRLIGGQGAVSSQSRNLLEAMKPFLSDKRRQKMDRALKIARLAKLAGLAIGETEGEGK